jgi:hypothetical protein
LLLVLRNHSRTGGSLRSSYLYLPILLLVSCGESGNNNSQSSSELSEPVPVKKVSGSTSNSSDAFKSSLSRKVELSPDLKNIKAFKSSINDFRLRVTALGGSYQGAALECRRSNYLPDKTVYRAVFNPAAAAAVVDLKVSNEGPAEVLFNCEIKDREQVLWQEEVRLLKNVIVNQTLSFDAALGSNTLGTVVLEDDATLITRGNVVTAEIKQLVSLGGRIVTFAESDVNTANNNDGASGGIIALQIEEAVGHLRVELRGRNAGKNTLRPDPVTKVPPKADDGYCLFVGRKKTYVEGSCKGRDAQHGFQGERGFRGYNGGATGSLQMLIKASHDLKLEIIKAPGLPGDGGQGGDGGPPGLPGLGAKIIDIGNDIIMTPILTMPMMEMTKKDRHDPGRPGKHGDIGPVGPDGKAGAVVSSKVIFAQDPQPNEHIIESNWTNFQE